MEQDAKKLLGSLIITPEIIEEIKKSVSTIADFGEKIQEYISQNTTKLLDVILFGAIHLEASDIHIEPQNEQVRLRVRVDGILQDALFFEKNIYHNLLSRLKLLSKLKLNITEKPQDGRLTIGLENSLIEIRTSSLPSEYGESIVMRILDPKNLIGINALKLRKDLYDILEKGIKKPNGMIVVAGPTGSGKTTTLYAFLMQIHNPSIKVITIEDPIEYHLTGISQTQVAPEKGYSFSEGLQSIVRQDPDVILVGEIRDLETAKIALQASLTGHLVLSTIHTNDAAGTIPRLVDLGADVSSIATAIKMVVGQRLLRTVCKKCATLVALSSQELVEIKKNLKNVPPELYSPEKFNETHQNFSLKNLAGQVKIARASEKGCSDCNFTGYKERKGIFEVFLVDAQMEKFILTNPSVSSIKELLVKRGMITLYQSGLIEVILGKTTLEEVQRVVEVDE